MVNVLLKMLKRLPLGFKITPTAIKVKIQVSHTTSSSKNNGSVNYMMIDEKMVHS